MVNYSVNNINSRAGYRDKLCTLSVWLAPRSADADQSEASPKNGSILIGPRLNMSVTDGRTSATIRTSSQLVNTALASDGAGALH